MSSPERTLVVTILKIFNWNQPQASNLFDISFFSLKTSSLILQKTVKASISSQEVHFNYSLKVAYQVDQNQIIIKLAHWQQNKNSMVEIAEFTLNLDHLAHKRIQFFPFGKNDKVLKIAAGQPERQSHSSQKLAFKNNDQFIREKQQFLRRIGNTTSSSRLKGDSSSVKSFSEQAMDLMVQIKNIKKHKNHQHSHLEQQFNDYYHQPNQYSQNIKSYRQMNKSNSASHLGVRGINRQGPTPAPIRVRGDENSSNRSNRSQKHKLILNNLEMVACQNEYYSELQEIPIRRGGKEGSSSLTKKRLFKSELY